MPPFVMGIDGGGTHTSACLVDAERGIIGAGEGGASNVHSIGLDAACDAIAGAASAAIRDAMNKDDEASRVLQWRMANLQSPFGNRPSAIHLLVCCVSGAGRPAEQETIRSALAARGLAQEIVVTHDAEATLASGMVFGAGIGVIAGTGSFAWGRDASGRTARADGWGSLLGDEGGAFAIGLNALRAACRHHDGRGPETRLLAAALRHYQVESAGKLIDLLATPAIPRDAVSQFAPKVFDAAEAMDPVAVGTVEEAVAGLARSALAVRRRLFADDEPAAFVLGGALARKQRYFQERFADSIRATYANDAVLCPEDSLAAGAARIALVKLGIDPHESLPAKVVPGSEAPETEAIYKEDSRRIFEECRTLLTEQVNPDAAGIDEMATSDILRLMNREDARVAPAVEKTLPQVAEAVERIVEAFGRGGRLFYIGAGTSGRLGCLDAAECPPTFGTPPGMVQGLIAGGVGTLLRSREGAEDRSEDAARDLDARGFCAKDVLVGLAASRRTPYVIAGLQHARQLGARTVLVTCSPPEKDMDCVDVPIAPVVGPEVVMGSTRLKAGTAQKMILNMLTTAAMIRMGKVYRSMMVDMQMSCDKLSERAKRIVMMLTGRDYESATSLLMASGGSVKRALVMAECGCSASEADEALLLANGFVRAAIQALKGGV